LFFIQRTTRKELELQRKYMRITFYLVLFVTGFVQLSGAIPVITRYQGYLKQPDGSPVNGHFKTTFKLYSERIGNEPVWEEIHEQVAFNKGMFSVVLGEHTPVPSKILDHDCYLGITLKNDHEIEPRQKLSGAVVLFQSDSVASMIDAFVHESKSADKTVTSERICNGSIVESKLADNSVTAQKIKNGSIGESKLADQSITTKKLSNGSITHSKLAKNAVTANKIKNGSIVESKIAEQAVTSRKIDNGSITHFKLSKNAVTTEKISNGAISHSKLAENAVTTKKISDAAVTESKLANNAVTTEKIGNRAISHSKLAENAVTTEKISNGSITHSKLAENSITVDKIKKGEILKNIKSNDGPGSGLDADLFDGIDSEAFLLKNDIFNNKQFGFGVQNPLAVLHVNGDAQFNHHITVSGGIQLGMVNQCDDKNEGMIRYHSKEKLMQFCNGSEWVFIDYKNQSSIAQPDCITNMLQMTFIKIQMSDSKNKHKILYMQTTETTQEQWRAVMGTNPSTFQCPGNCPVENVSWNDIQKFINKINRNEKVWRYRLPTENEWIYAASSGRIREVQQHHMNTNVKTICTKDPVLERFAWYCANSDNSTQPVAQKAPNDWMLYDMQGNVMEWCSSSFITSELTSLIDASFKLIKGGSWAYDSKGLDLNARSWLKPNHRDSNIGFRLVMELKTN